MGGAKGEHQEKNRTEEDASPHVRCTNPAQRFNLSANLRNRACATRGDVYLLFVGRLNLCDGKRHELDGRPVEQHSQLELRLRGDQWIRGEYQWSGVLARWPGLRVELGGRWERAGLSPQPAPAAVLALHPDAELRWPK